jgi:hypothetical protein
MLRPTNLLRATCSILAVALGAPACVIDGGGATEGEGEGDGDEADGGVCTEPAVVPCRDQAFQALNMNLNEVASGAIASEGDGAGTFEVEVDATAGGFNGDGGFVYGRFTDQGLESVTLLDDASFDSMDWDIAFRRFVIRLNSGTSGPSCVTGARTGPATDFDALATVPAGLTFNAENFMSDPDSCELVPDGSGLGSPGVVLQNWWEYPGCVATTGNVYVLSLANGRHVKLVVTRYYATGQETCNASGTAGSNGGNILLRYAFLD